MECLQSSFIIRLFCIAQKYDKMNVMGLKGKGSNRLESYLNQ